MSLTSQLACSMPYYVAMRHIFFPLISGTLLMLTACSLPLAPPRTPPTSESDNIKYSDQQEVYCGGQTPAQLAFDALVYCANQGDPVASARLGEMYLNGEGNVLRNSKVAFYWFSKGAECGLPYAEVQMGHFYRDGIGVEKDIRLAICWYEKAAHQCDITAMLALGDLYGRGWHGVKINREKAYYWYSYAASLGSYEAEYRKAWSLVRGKSRHRAEQGLATLTAAAEQGNAEALSDLGDLYAEGRLVRKDLKLSRAYYLSAVEQGSSEAAFKLGMLSEAGEGVPRNREEAARWFMIAGERDYAPAQLLLGNLYRDGWGVEKNYQQAAFWYTKAADQGIASAESELGDLYHSGSGVTRNLQEAARHYQLAAEHPGQPYAQLMLSILYQEGRGVSADMVKSMQWYKAASKQSGFLMAEFRVGRRYATGFGLPKDLKEAHRWYSFAANQGFVLAEIELAEMYYFGRGMEQDFEEAYRWYHKAAKQGHAYAQYMVGLMTLEGNGVPQNATKASIWIRNAAYQGARQAQYQLGLLYLNGDGINQSDIHAYAWLKTGLMEQMDQTPDVLKSLIDRMTPQSRMRAVALGEQYTHRYPAVVHSPQF